MSSILKVDTIQDQSGNNIINESGNVITIGASGDTITVPAGATVSGFTSAGIDDNATSTAITISSGEDVTFTENILLGDNKKAKFGTGNDLEIYHDSTSGHSFLKESGSGSLVIQTNNLVVQNAAGTANIINAPEGTAGLDLYYNGNIKLSTANNGVSVTGDLTVDTNTLFVDSSNNRVGIGTNSPGFDLVVKDASGACTIRAENGADNKIVDLIADSTGGLIRTIGSYPLVFNTNQTERARFDASGNFLVGKTSSNTATAGIELRATDQVTITRSGNTPLIINRLSSDGELVKFQKDGTNIGYIGNASADFAVSNSTATNGAGISLQNNLFVTPMKGGSKDTSSAVSLGNTSYTWKDIYLSGGAFIGGTGTANKLDDYEEGTWTPVLTTSGNTDYSSVGYSIQYGHYTKVGQMVTAQCRVQTNSFTQGSPSGNIRISGLPFTVCYK